MSRKDAQSYLKWAFEKMIGRTNLQDLRELQTKDSIKGTVFLTPKQKKGFKPKEVKDAAVQVLNKMLLE